jgi:nitroimidazol reductase NimA-like FMN-containing flavoprotein (pyridoxamine 5'-phosphate oxidase superfamily)
MVRMLRHECLQRLAEHSVGRVAVTAHALPAIIPVNYVLDDHSIVFRTRGGGLLARGCDDSVVAIEVDDVAADGSGGWSVLVVGVARLLVGSQAVRAAQLDIVSAMGSDRDQFISIDIGRVSGRRVGAQAVYDDSHVPGAERPPSLHGVG